MIFIEIRESLFFFDLMRVHVVATSKTTRDYIVESRSSQGAPIPIWRHRSGMDRLSALWLPHFMLGPPHRD
jgi:hypothetical protein